jgi:DNA-binding transcriptional regulator YiaG
MGATMTARAKFSIPGEDLLAEPYRYQASGLDYVFLLNGVAREATQHGIMVSIKNIHGLHRAIGLHIVEKSVPMAGAEFRFLRKQMGLTQRTLATLMRTSEQAVATCESNKTKSGPADALMRMTYLLHVVPEATRADVLRPMIDQWAAGEHAKLPDGPRRKIVQLWREGSNAAA